MKQNLVEHLKHDLTSDVQAIMAALKIIDLQSLSKKDANIIDLIMQKEEKIASNLIKVFDLVSSLNQDK